MVTKAATTTNCTMIRIRIGIVFLINDIITFENAVITATASPITIAGFNWEVTAREEQIPNTCTSTGLSTLNGLVKTSLFSFENSLLISLFLLFIYHLKMSYTWKDNL